TCALPIFATRVIDYVRGLGLPGAGIEIIGLRPGEKRHEALTSQGLSMQPTAHARILSARQRPIPAERVRAALASARRACARGDAEGALDTLRRIVSDFNPSGAAL